MNSEKADAPRAVIVISSHVARGSVGNRAAVFALETLGFPVWAVPTVILPWHPGHGRATRIVPPLDQFKALMADLSDAFIALPGGLGTFEEIFEIWTWSQLGMHRKPLGFLNVDDYFSSLATFLDRAVDEGFIKAEHRDVAAFESDGEAMLRRFATFTAPSVRTWIDHART